MDRKWWTLLAACTATFMLLLDITIVNVALPDIQKVTSHVEGSLRSVHGIDATKVAHAVAIGSTKQAVSSAPPGARAAIAHAAKSAFVSGLDELFLVAAILSFVGAALGFLLVRRRDFVHHGAPAAARAK